MRSFKEARRPQATISGIISQKKTSNQKNFHHDGRTSANTVSGAGFDCAATFAAMGNPQDGQAGASVETGFPHSGQLTNAMALSPYRILGRRTKACQGQPLCKSKFEGVSTPFTTPDCCAGSNFARHTLRNTSPGLGSSRLLLRCPVTANSHPS